MGAHAEDHAAFVVALFQHLAGRRNLAAQLLAIVGDADVPLDEVTVEEREQAFAQGRRRRGAGPTSPPRPGQLAEQRVASYVPCPGVAHTIDLVEHQQARHVPGADVGEHLVVTASWRSNVGADASTT